MGPLCLELDLWRGYQTFSPCEWIASHAYSGTKLPDAASFFSAFKYFSADLYVLWQLEILLRA